MLVELFGLILSLHPPALILVNSFVTRLFLLPHPLGATCDFIVESDAKMCIEDLSYPTNIGCWKIRNFSVRTVDLISGFVSCNVQWERREGNQVAHALAKAVFSLAFPFRYSLDTLPPSVKEV